MASSKTRRAAALTALSAALVLGGVAAAQADGPDVICHGKGQGHGTGAPGGGNGQGGGTGKQGKGKGLGTGAPSHNHGCESHGSDDEHHGGASENSGGSNENGGGQTSGGGSDDSGGTIGGTENNGGGTGGVTVDIDVEVGLPAAGEVAGQVVDGSLGILQPFAEQVIGQTVQAVDQTTDLARSDVSGMVELLGTAGSSATTLAQGSVVADATVADGNAGGTVEVNGIAGPGLADLGGQVVGGTFGIFAGTARGLTNVVAGFAF